MEFAGNNFVYISQKKKNKVKEIQQGNKDAPPKIEEVPSHLEESQQIDKMEIALSLSSEGSNEKLSICSGELEENIDIDDDASPKLQQQNLKQGEVIKTEIDTNVFVLKLATLETPVQNIGGSPIKCKNCSSILNLYSALQSKDNGFEWKCEFCDTVNPCTMDKDSIPITPSFDMVIEKKAETTKKETEKLDDESSLIFCFDVSGSMSQSYQVDSKVLKKFRSIQKNSAKQKMLQQHMFGDAYNNDDSYISRMECVQIAIENNILELVKTSPKVKVGLVTFGTNVEVLGDCMSNRLVLKTADVNNEEKIINLGEENTNLFKHNISQSQQKVIDALYKCEENGQTALGPSVLLSLSMLKNAPNGSRIFLCTDGCSNLGLGSISSNANKSKEFYIKMGDLAKERGVAISLITFQDSESEIAVLQEMVERSGGEIIRVNPSEIIEGFSDLLDNKIVATKVAFEINLHQYLTFRNEDKNKLLNNGSSLKKEVGNAAKETEFYYEFKFKKAFKLADMPNINLENSISMPFQAIINYTNGAGDKMQRVITKFLKLNDNKEEVEKQAIFEIISANAMQKAAKLASEGQYTKAQANAQLWRRYMSQNQSKNLSAQTNLMMFNSNFNGFNQNLSNARTTNQIGPMQMQSSVSSDEFQQQIHSFQNVSQKRQETYFKRKKK